MLFEPCDYQIEILCLFRRILRPVLKVEEVELEFANLGQYPTRIPQKPHRIHRLISETRLISVLRSVGPGPGRYQIKALFVQNKQLLRQIPLVSLSHVQTVVATRVEKAEVICISHLLAKQAEKGESSTRKVLHESVTTMPVF